MKNKIALLLILLLMGLTTHAFAFSLFDYSGSDFVVTDRSRLDIDVFDSTYDGYSGPDYTGYYLGTIGGNTEDSMEAAIRYYLGDPTYMLNELKVDDIPDAEPLSAGSATTYPLTVTWDVNHQNGTWTLDEASGIELGFYAVKGGNEFALYYVYPFEASGDWTTAHILNGGGKIPTISHFSAAAPAPVPEPATLLLLGTGLIGLAGVTRRKIKK